MRQYKNAMEAVPAFCWMNEKSINRGHSSRRVLHNPAEFHFAREWDRENKPRSWLNHGHGILQDLFIDAPPFGGCPRTCIKKITLRERMIVATVIQWLGSNCGFSWLCATLEKAGYKVVPIDD